MRQYPLYAVVMCVCCLSVFSTQADPGPQQKRWAIFPSGAHYHCVATVNTRYMWMRSGLWCGQVQRYDMKTRKMTVFTARDGLPLTNNGVERMVASDDDKCLLMLEHKPMLFLYSEKTGWRSLPPLDKIHTVKDIAFDSDGGVIVLTENMLRNKQSKSCSVLRLKKGEWHPERQVNLPHISAIVPFANAYVIKSYDKTSRRIRLFRVDKSSDNEPVEVEYKPFDENRLPYFRLKGKTYLATPTRMIHPKLPRYSYVRIMETLREITPNGVIQTPKKSPQLLDLKTGTFKPISVSVLSERKISCSGTGVKTFEIDTRKTGSIFPIRDSNGDVWLASRRTIDGKWTPTAGARHEVRGIEAARTDRAYYDDKKDRWRRTVPLEYGAFSMVDAKKKLAWVMPDYNAATMRLMDFSGPKPRVIRQVPRDPQWGLPRFQDRQGRWWMLRLNVVRLDPDGRIKRYPLHKPTAIWLTPFGNDIWTYKHPDHMKYDPVQDKFVKSKPEIMYDEHAVRIGAYEYASFPWKHGQNASKVMRKVNGRWGSKIYGVRNGDRLLINDWSGGGIWEYDAVREISVRLHPGGGFHLAFDAKGRRVLASHSAILLYTGDPFKDPGYLKHAGKLTSQKKILAECVKQLNSTDPQTQQLGEQKIQALSLLVKPNIETITSDHKTPEHTRKLLTEALKHMSKDSLPPSLFQAAHPPCKPYQPPR